MAIYYLHELAGEELAKEWPKRKVLQDLIPDDRKVQGLKNARWGLSLHVRGVLQCCKCQWPMESSTEEPISCRRDRVLFSLVVGYGIDTVAVAVMRMFYPVRL